MNDAVNAMQDGRLRKAQLRMLQMLKTIDAICVKNNIDYWLEGGTLLGAVRHQGFIPWDDDLDISMSRESFKRFLEIAPRYLPENIKLQTPYNTPGYFNLSVPLKIRDTNSRLVEWHETGNETYLQGIFIDVFVYDTLPENSLKRDVKLWYAKKLLRTISHFFTKNSTGHNNKIYYLLSRCTSRSFLLSKLNKLITNAEKDPSPWMGYGFDCVNKNLIHRDDIYPLQRAKFEDGEFYIANKADTILSQLYGDYMKLPPKSQQKMMHCRELEVWDASKVIET